MRAGEPAACVTPDSETHAQLHSGGVPGSYPVVLKFNYENEMRVGAWEGILSFHDFYLHENGDVTAWKSSRIGPGKRFTKEFLDKKYAKRNEQSPELQVPAFPQGSTGARFTTVLAAEDFIPKFEWSKTRKRQLAADKEGKAAERKKRKLEDGQAPVTTLQSVKDQRAPHKCQTCGTGYKRFCDADKNKNKDDGKKSE
jgi:hypothetical protein